MNEHHMHVLFFFFFCYTCHEYTESCLEKGEHTLYYITVRYLYVYNVKCFVQGRLISASQTPRRTMCHDYVGYSISERNEDASFESCYCTVVSIVK